jgi:negative regulator of flagellin synthesis FlgM
MGRILRKEECMLQLLQVVREIPEIRQEKVKKLKDRIGQGRYTVDADALAERMLEEALAEALHKSRKPRH